MVYEKNSKNLEILLLGGPSDVHFDLVQKLLEKQANEVIVLGSDLNCGTNLVSSDAVDFIIPNSSFSNNSSLQIALSKLDSLFVSEPDNLIFEIKNYCSGFKDVDLGFLNSDFVDRNGNKVPDYVKFYGGSSGQADLRYLYKKTNYIFY